MTLRKQVLKSGATIMDRLMITDLIKKDGVICGAVGMSVSEANFYIIHAKAVILTTGASSLKCTGWPNSNLTSDGDMMAFRAGATITGKEYNDVHTTSVHFPNYVGPLFLNKALEGPPPAIYKTADGKPFEAVTLFHLAPEFEAHQGQAPIEWTRRAGGNGKPVGPGNNDGPSKESPISPLFRPKDGTITTGATVGMSTHKSEGIWPTDLEGGTDLAGLYAAGDALGAMLCGAAYSAAGISVAGSGVMGKIAATAAVKYVQGRELECVDETLIAPLRERMYAPIERSSGFDPDWVLQLINNLMVPYFILYVKHKERLEASLTLIKFYREHLIPMLRADDPHALRLALECENLALNCEMKLRTSLMREESRGTHYREDFPERDDENWLGWILIRNNDGAVELVKEPIPDEWKPDANLSAEEKYLYKFPDTRNTNECEPNANLSVQEKYSYKFPDTRSTDECKPDGEKQLHDTRKGGN